MKKTAIITLIFALMLCIPALAAEGAVAVVGADLSEAEIESVYDMFGLERGSVEELTITNRQEREYLEGMVPEEQLGTRSISCVLVSPSDGGLDVSTENITWCTDGMFLSAMSTAGMEDVSVIAAAPFEVSGTAALAGIFMAYEDMTGAALTDEAKLAAAAELTTTASLTGELGDGVLSMITELKLIIDDLEGMSDSELTAKLDELAGEIGIELNDFQREQLVELCRRFEQLDTDALADKVSAIKDKLADMGELKEKAVSFWDAIVSFFKAIAEFVSRIFAIFAG